jgi:hypothetical protein
VLENIPYDAKQISSASEIFGEKDMNERKWTVRDLDILGGTPVFAGTRVPAQTLIDFLKGVTLWKISWTISQRLTARKPSACSNY